MPIREENGMKYAYGDITIVPETLSNVRHRSECNPFVSGSDNMLPIFTAPMSQIIDCENYDFFEKCGINAILPRNIEYEKRINFIIRGKWAAFSLDEIHNMISEFPKELMNAKTIRVCLDIANGHMKEVLLTCESLKNVCQLNEIKCIIMTGNIANPNWIRYMNQTYGAETTPIDYVRCGIGGGSMCFASGTKVKMGDGNLKKIEDVKVGDLVETKNGVFEVTSTFNKESDKIIEINNDVKCTLNHEFLVINKTDKNNVNDNNLDKYGYWVEADKLDKDKHLLMRMFESAEIKTIEIINDKQTVYDLEVDKEHTYIANGYIVHNCITTTQTRIHYPMASLIEECVHNNFNKTLKIIADGGIKNYGDVITAIGLGADYVMIGGLFARSLEACGKMCIPTRKSNEEVLTFNLDDDDESHKKIFIIDHKPYREYYGMASKKAQKEFGGSGNKTSEGKSDLVKVEYTLKGWVDNMTSYLRSAMSYTNSFNLDDFRGNVEFVVNSMMSIKSINE